MSRRGISLRGSRGERKPVDESEQPPVAESPSVPAPSTSAASRRGISVRGSRGQRPTIQEIEQPADAESTPEFAPSTSAESDQPATPSAAPKSTPMSRRGVTSVRGVPFGRSRPTPGDTPPPKAEVELINWPEDPEELRRREAQKEQIETLLTNIRRVFKSVPVLCKRKPPGTKGNPLTVVSNLFEVKLPHGTLNHYDVKVIQMRRVKDSTTGATIPKKHRCASTLLNRRVVETLQKTFHRELDGARLAYDGKANIYTRKVLPKKEGVYEVNMTDGDDIETFAVVLKLVGVVSFDSLHAMYEGRAQPEFFQEVLTASDIVLKSGPIMAYVPSGNSLYQSTGRYPAVDLTGGLEAWFGFYATLRLGAWKPMLNINMSSTGFFKEQNLINFVCEFLNRSENDLRRGLNPADRRRLVSQLNGLKVHHTHFRQQRKHRIDGLSRRGASQEDFACGEGRITVQQYFKQKYEIDLRFPELPCVMDKRGSLVPMELCHISFGQVSRKKLNEEQTRRMVKQASIEPSLRFARIKESFESLHSVAQPFLNEFEMNLDPKNIVLEARVLPSPTVSYKGKAPVRTVDGVWRASQFLRGEQINEWGVVVHGRCDRVSAMIQTLIDEGRRLDLMIRRPLFVKDFNDRADEAQILRGIRREYPNIELVVFLLGNNSQYCRVKQEAETSDICMRTQCVKTINVDRKFNNMFAGNLLQKINTKMGGMNNGILSAEKTQAMKEPFMLIGIDVSHAAPGSLEPSIAALVASMDSAPSQYHTVTSSNTARNEYIRDMKNMLLECLDAFKSKNDRLPTRLIFYRDGVAETQFEKIRLYELCAIREACLEERPDYTPLVTFIVVQKRHHVRFIPQDPKQGTGKCRNIPAGTLVDTQIVNPCLFDFFLCSHQGIQGTSRPTRYQVVHDDSEMTQDDIYKMTFQLCHVYARCTRSVSIPAPCYYAHLAAFRARDYIKAVADIRSQSSEEEVNLEQCKKAVEVHPAMKDIMYFV